MPHQKDDDPNGLTPFSRLVIRVEKLEAKEKWRTRIEWTAGSTIIGICVLAAAKLIADAIAIH